MIVERITPLAEYTCDVVKYKLSINHNPFLILFKIKIIQLEAFKSLKILDLVSFDTINKYNLIMVSTKHGVNLKLPGHKQE